MSATLTLCNGLRGSGLPGLDRAKARLPDNPQGSELYEFMKPLSDASSCGPSNLNPADLRHTTPVIASGQINHYGVYR
jgi:hypothetical protein